MKTLLSSVAAVGLIGGVAFGQGVVLVPQGETAAGQQQFILVPVPREEGAQQGASEEQMRERAEAMALDLYRRGYQRGLADAQSAAGTALDPAAMEQIGRELFERGYMLGLMQAHARMTAQETPKPGEQGGATDQQAAAEAGATAGAEAQASATGATGQAAGTNAAGQQVTPQDVAQAVQGTAATGTAAAGQAGTEAAEGPQVVIGSAESEQHGVYLTDDTGRAVYILEADQQGEGEDAQAKSTCYDKCAEVWPPVTSPVKPLAEDQANEEELGTIQRDGGDNQVTYNGWPLYYYSRDEGAAQPTGHDVHDEWGEWYLLQPSGEPVGH